MAQTGHMKSQREKSHPQAKQRGLRRNQCCKHLDFGCLASRIENKCLGVFAGFLGFFGCGGSSSQRAGPLAVARGFSSCIT